MPHPFPYWVLQEKLDLSEAIALRETEAGRPQIVVLSAPARQVLQVLKGLRDAQSPWVLPSSTDPARPLSKDALENGWARNREAAGIADVRLHDLRHTVGTYAGQTGANAFLVRDLYATKIFR